MFTIAIEDKEEIKGLVKRKVVTVWKWSILLDKSNEEYDGHLSAAWQHYESQHNNFVSYTDSYPIKGTADTEASARRAAETTCKAILNMARRTRDSEERKQERTYTFNG